VIVGIASVTLLAVSIPLIARLRTLEGDRATAVRVVYSILVVVAYAVLPVAWGVGAIPTGGLVPFLSAPLAMRLGDVVSHRSGDALREAVREAILLLVAFAVLFAVGVALVP
jgi:1,4-dihydroxy-2-naphthoate octaprenyltransferase